MKTYQLPTWRCQCGYSQDFEPTQENIDTHFNNPTNFPLNDLSAGNCPSCALKGRVGALRKENDPTKKIVASVLEDADIDAKQDLSHAERIALKEEARAKREELGKL